uniref:Uncharacterized protein n=1 Tax=Mimivirus LCMiAC02 TaxID=2506609 RepID=A0A4P6VP93_9VIRU|nr:MAG: hypothetical protein LCMiAC02_04830 [Mimivirus LCMiAC02]
MGKYKKIYKILNCSIDIPINDIDGWKMNKEHRWIYNKMRLCEYQGTEHGPMPIEPEKYPIIIKPIVNIYGMGLNIIKVNNKDEFYDNWYNNNFWMEYFEGEHLSWDIIIYNGKIKYHTCFKGYKDKEVIGKFDYWESMEKELPEIVKRLIGDHFKTYYGCLNIETIDNKMIEGHLRMGDIDCFPTLEILKGIIATYKKEEYNWDIKVDKVFFYPVWGKEAEEAEDDDVYEYMKKDIVPLLEKNIYIHDYGVDDEGLSSPSDKFRRLMWFTCSYKEFGERIRELIYERIQNR